MNKTALIVPEDSAPWRADLKSRIASARQRAVLAVNQEQIRLYWQIGREILERQQVQAWGAKVIERLANDLQAAFPEIKGFSARNLKYMRFFAERCPDAQIGQQAAAQLPWFHIVLLITKLDDPVQREWYAHQTVEQGWSRATLKRRWCVTSRAFCWNWAPVLPSSAGNIVWKWRATSFSSTCFSITSASNAMSWSS